LRALLNLRLLLHRGREEENIDQESHANQGRNHAAKINCGPFQQFMKEDHHAKSSTKVYEAADLHSFALLEPLETIVLMHKF